MPLLSQNLVAHGRTVLLGYAIALMGVLVYMLLRPTCSSHPCPRLSTIVAVPGLVATLQLIPSIVLVRSYTFSGFHFFQIIR